MKKLVLTLMICSFFAATSVFGQTVGVNYGNISPFTGSSTSNVSLGSFYDKFANIQYAAPNYKLYVRGSLTGTSVDQGGILVDAGDYTGVYSRTSTGTAIHGWASSSGYAGLFDGKTKFDGTAEFTTNVGIAITPTSMANHERLAVRGGMITTEGIGNGISLNGSYFSSSTNDFGTQNYGLFMGDGSLVNLSTAQTNGHKPMVLSNFYGLGFNTNKGKMVLCENGVVAIASDNNLIEDIAERTDAQLEFQLFVEEGIRSERVRVDVQGTWFDYVFEEDYQLPTLYEVEAFVQKNHHLPDIPSEKEVRANGIDMAEMDGLLLKKIEELTLYTIEQQKQLEQLQQQNAALINRIEQLENQ